MSHKNDSQPGFIEDAAFVFVITALIMALIEQIIAYLG